MSKKLVIVLVAVAGLFFAAGLYAAVADVVKSTGKNCPPTKAEVEFNHKTHSEEYIKKYAKPSPTGAGSAITTPSTSRSKA